MAILCNVEIMAAGCVGKALYLALRISQLAPSAYFPLIYGNYSGGSLGGGGCRGRGQVQTLKSSNTAL